VDWGVLTYTMHPYVIGRGYRMLALEEMVDRLAKEGATFVTMEDAAREAEKLLPQIKRQSAHQSRMIAESITVACTIRDTKQYSAVWCASSSSPGPMIAVGGPPIAGVRIEASVKYGAAPTSPPTLAIALAMRTTVPIQASFGLVHTLCASSLVPSSTSAPR